MELQVRCQKSTNKNTAHLTESASHKKDPKQLENGTSIIDV